ncbi:glycosyl transferase family protein [Sphingomonas sp. BK481]|uniref:glycosyl transferase family protein n=1 Tax=Sphingomonas sp. BK481 TaxID=2586981 RepID=UPI00161D60C5|nr:glycosyl transferase family protein [Sphingomonas sp. BK481]MBB3586680.1 adsorption protein B [Sphingomonas sp. BK481]
MSESLGIIDIIVREAVAFAAVGLLIGGIDDLLVDIAFFFWKIWRGPSTLPGMDALPTPSEPGRLAVFVPAWDEVAVIGAMLSAAVARFDHDDYRIFVGLYPNDRATIDAAARVAARDPRIRLVIGQRDGPTTKADCLNTLWHALRRADDRDGRRTKAVVLHDAEDVVHPLELRVFDSLIDHYAVVQLPVLPLVKRGSRLVSGHYADEFAEAHMKQLVIRTALGAGMPLAGTGCAMSTAILETVAVTRDGDPFDASSLTEDYELGLRIAQLGGAGRFARIVDDAGALIAVRAFFPATFDAAVRQKARWMTGIALAGWDRTGWARPQALADHWMRMRDRRAPLSMVVLAAAYVGLTAWVLTFLVHAMVPAAQGWPAMPVVWLAGANIGLLVWRLGMRMAFTARIYGLAEAFWSLPRFVVGNVISLIAAPRAVVRYIAMLRGAALVWDKTRHEFPDLRSSGG